MYDQRYCLYKHRSLLPEIQLICTENVFLMPEANREVYEQGDVVDAYLQHGHLTRGERLLFTRYAADISNRKVLDLGVGGGRTTPVLSDGASEYWGVDYSGAMVEACRRRFAGQDHVRFVQDDARTLAHCPEAYFDLVVFSFNGIDVVDMEGRAAVLQAVARVLRPGGSFIFSFHNAGYLDTLYRYHWQKNPLRWWANYQRLGLIRSHNGPKEQFTGKPYFFLKDGGEDFRLDICYVRPEYQLQQLAEAGYRVSDIVASLSGKELSPLQAATSRDCWLYFRCTRP